MIFKGIYERLDSEIEKYESTIEQLSLELQAAKKNELPYLQIANEISATYPSIRHVYMGQGAHVAIDSMQVSSCLMVKVQTDSLMPATSIDQLKKWIQIRLQVDNVLVENTIAIE